MSRTDWTDPAPLEVERAPAAVVDEPPQAGIYALSLVIALAVIIWLLIFVARRLYRYPLAIVGGAVLAGLGVGWSWWAAAGLLGASAALGRLWCWAHRDSFHRTVARQLRSEWRRATVYAWPWQRVTLFCELTKRTSRGVRGTHYPKIRRVRSDGWRDRVAVKMLHGQWADHYAHRAEELAHSLDARACRVRVERDRRIWLDLLHLDPLADPLPAPALAMRPSRSTWSSATASGSAARRRTGSARTPPASPG